MSNNLATAINESEALPVTIPSKPDPVTLEELQNDMAEKAGPHDNKIFTDVSDICPDNKKEKKSEKKNEKKNEKTPERKTSGKKPERKSSGKKADKALANMDTNKTNNEMGNAANRNSDFELDEEKKLSDKKFSEQTWTEAGQNLVEALTPEKPILGTVGNIMYDIGATIGEMGHQAMNAVVASPETEKVNDVNKDK